MAKTKRNYNQRGQKPEPGSLRLEIRQILDNLENGGEAPKISELAERHDVRPQRASYVWKQELARRGLVIKTQRVITATEE